MKFERIQAGMTLFDVHSMKVGNVCGLSTIGTWHVKVLEVDQERRRALVSWNTNPAAWWSERQLATLKDKRPLLVQTRFGYRRPTREELKELRAQQKEPK